MTLPRASFRHMRTRGWSLVLVAVLASTALARTKTKKHPVAGKPKKVSIARTAAPPPAEVPAPAAKPSAYTNDPVLAGADRVIGRDRKNMVAFTFDDGPFPSTTPAVIEALQKYDIPATFFIVMRHIEQTKNDTTEKEASEGRAILAHELELGYTIGNHTAHHANLGKADDKKLQIEMDDAFATLSNTAKRPVGLFRAPYGRLTARGRTHLHELGATEVFWSIDTRDWQLKDAVKLRKKTLKFIKDEAGGVVLMHDARPITAKIIADVLDDLEAENCARLAAKQEPIWPVSIHYFLRDNGVPRAIPDDVAKRTAEYKNALPGRCASRASNK